MESGGPTRNATQSKSEGHPRMGEKRSNSKPKEDYSDKETPASEYTLRGITGGSREGERGDGGIVKLFYTNAQSIGNKMNILKAQILELCPHIIAITEAWTHEDIVEAELKLEGYEIVARSDRKDTVDGRGGGVIIYSSLSNVSPSKLQTSFHEITAVKFSNKHEPDLHIHILYRSPNSSETNNEYLLKHISNIPENTVIIGDFNCSEIDWNNLTVNGSENSFKCHTG